MRLCIVITVLSVIIIAVEIDNKIPPQSKNDNEDVEKQKEISKNSVGPSVVDTEDYDYETDDDDDIVISYEEENSKKEELPKLPVRKNDEELFRASLTVREGENFTLPCLSRDRLKEFVNSKVQARVELKGRGRLMKLELEGEEVIVTYKKGSETIPVVDKLPNPVLNETGTYTCIVVGNKFCMFNGKKYLCKKYKIKTEFTVHILKKDKVIARHSEGSLIRNDKAQFTCSKGYISPTPSDKIVKRIDSYVGTNVTVVKLNDNFKEMKDSVLNCSTSFFGALRCSASGDGIKLESHEGDSDKFILTLSGLESEISGRYLCITHFADPDYSESLCSYNNNFGDVREYSLSKCKDLMLSYEGLVYRKTDKLKIKKVKTTLINQAGDYGMDFEIVAKGSDKEAVTCAVQSAGRQWLEYEEINGKKASRGDVLRCCLFGSGCAHHRIWSEFDTELFDWNWIFFPTIKKVERGKVKISVHLQRKNPGDEWLNGICRNEDIRKHGEMIMHEIRNILFIAVIVTMVVTSIIGHIIFARQRIGRYRLGTEPHIRIHLAELGQYEADAGTTDLGPASEGWGGLQEHFRNSL